jgi:predicted Zn-dependent protease
VDLRRRLADSLQRLRRDARLTQVEMAHTLGISQPTLARLESAAQNVTIDTLARLCDLEREADEGGVKLMADSGYQPRELSAIFDKMRAASPDRGAAETFFWGSHPRLSERIETVDHLAARFPGKTTQAAFLSQQDFDRRLIRVRVDNASCDAYFGWMTLA